MGADIAHLITAQALVPDSFGAFPGHHLPGSRSGTHRYSLTGTLPLPAVTGSG